MTIHSIGKHQDVTVMLKDGAEGVTVVSASNLVKGDVIKLDGIPYDVTKVSVSKCGKHIDVHVEQTPLTENPKDDGSGKPKRKSSGGYKRK